MYCCHCDLHARRQSVNHLQRPKVAHSCSKSLLLTGSDSSAEEGSFHPHIRLLCDEANSLSTMLN